MTSQIGKIDEPSGMEGVFFHAAVLGITTWAIGILECYTISDVVRHSVLVSRLRTCGALAYGF